jgi:type I restriction enzyme, S subunit
MKKQGWRVAKIKDIGRVVTGRTPSTADSANFGLEYPFITPSDMDGRRVIAQTERYISQQGAQLMKSTLIPSGSVIVSCIGWQMGKVAMNQQEAFTNQQINTIIPNEKVIPEFIHYSLSTRREELKNLGSVGTRTPILIKSVFEQIELSLPPLATQRKIAAILSAYDDLIENNARRIAILEEMARILYREWFVEFRFPGHEGVRMVNGVPEGWKKRQLGEICDEVRGIIQTGPFGSQLHQSDYTEEGVPVVMPKDIVDSRVSTDSIAHISEGEANRLLKHRLSAGDIVYGRRGDIGRRALITEHQEGWLCGTGCLRISLGRKVIDPLLLYLYLGRPEIVTWIANKAVGATLPNLNTGIIRSIEVVCPPLDMQSMAIESLYPCFELIQNLVQRNSNLRHTRDLLLPKLISGELDVEEVFIVLPHSKQEGEEIDE